MQDIVRIDLGGVNSYLVRREERFLLVDTGGHMFLDKTYTDRREILEQRLKEQGVNENNLAMIVLTHGDNDHVCNAAYLREKFHAPIAMHSEDVWMVERRDPLCYKDNSNYESVALRLIFHLMSSRIELLMKRVYKDFQTFSPDILLEDGTDLSFYGFDGVIYHAPGHTEGSICILDGSGNLICGDLFANNKKPSLAVNARNFKQMRESAKKLLNGQVVRIYPGHGTPFARDCY